MDDLKHDGLDVARRDAAFVTFSEWRVADGARQQAAMDAALDAWREFAWPDGLLSHTCLAAEDGVSLRHHAQWTTSAASERVTATSGDRFAAICAAAGTEIERYDLLACQPPISFRPPGAAELPAACVVIVDIHLREPSAAVQRGWIDIVLDALAHQSPAGLVAAHFHPSTDHARVVNLAAWTSAQAHRDALEDGVPGGVNHDDDRRWQLVRSHPGVADLSHFTRYPARRTMSAPTS